MDLGGEETVRVDDEGHLAAMRLEILLRESVEVVLRSDRSLIREDGAPVLFCGLGRDLILDVAGYNSSVKAPNMHLEGKVVADERDLVLVDGRVDDRECAGAGWTFKILELIDGYPRARGGPEHRGIFEGSLGQGGDARW